MMPVLFIAYYFPPVGGGGVQRSEKFARYLPAEGFLPIVVTCAGPDSAERWLPSDRSLGDGLPPDIQIFRAASSVPPSHTKFAGNIARWLGMQTVFSRWWTKVATEVAWRATDGAQLIFATMSPFATADVASNISNRLGIPWIADLRDPWALDEMQIYPSRFHRAVERRRMERALSTAAGIIMNTPEAAAALQQSIPSLKDKKIATITNGYDASDFNRPLSPRTDGKFRIIHTGYLHTAIGLQVRRRRRLYRLLGGLEGDVDILTRSHVLLLDAIHRWIAGRGEVAQDIDIILAGLTSAEDRAAVTDCPVRDLVRFSGYISHNETVDLIRSADLLFLPMHNLANGSRARVVPGKTYEYMAAGRPILAPVPEGDARDFLKEAGTGLLCKPDDIEAMIQHLDDAYNRWKQKAPGPEPNWQFIETFERRSLTKRLGQFFEEVLETQPSRGLEALGGVTSY